MKLEEHYKKLEEIANNIKKQVRKIKLPKFPIDLNEEDIMMEIDANVGVAKLHLKTIHQNNWDINEDFSGDEELYRGCEDYRRTVNHLHNHLFKLMGIPQELKEDRFEFHAYWKRYS